MHIHDNEFNVGASLLVPLHSYISHIQEKPPTFHAFFQRVFSKPSNNSCVGLQFAPRLPQRSPQRLQRPGLPTGYQVLKAIRVEDSAMFRRYVEKRHRIQQTRGVSEGAGSLSAPAPQTLTRQERWEGGRLGNSQW